MPASSEGTPSIDSASQERVDLGFRYHGDRERDGREARDGDADRPLREHGQTHPGVEEDDRPAAPVPAVGGERDEEREEDVEDARAPEHLEELGGAERDRGEERRARRQEAPRERPREEQRARGREPRDEAPGVEAEAGGLAEGREPEEERRLLRVDLAVQVGDEVLVEDEHLARYLGVARLVGVPEVAQAERRQADQRRQD